MTTHNQQTEQAAKHSALPWQNAGFRDHMISDTSGFVVARVGDQFVHAKPGEIQANADFICRAVNSHYELVGLLNAILPELQALYEVGYCYPHLMTDIRSALAKAQA
jgi:hypothetical protein